MRLNVRFVICHARSYRNMIVIKHWLFEANFPPAVLNPCQTVSDERKVAEIGVDGDTGD